MKFKIIPFYIPITHPSAQLLAYGEIFHARTKAWKDFNVKKIEGINAMNFGGNGHVRDHLKSNLSQEELMNQFKKYKSKAIQLK